MDWRWPCRQQRSRIVSEIMLSLFLPALNAVTDADAGRTRSQNNIAYIPPVDAVQEVRVITNFYDAQYGRTGGGVFNAIKGGQSVPMKWRISDGGTGWISSLSVVSTVTGSVYSAVVLMS